MPVVVAPSLFWRAALILATSAALACGGTSQPAPPQASTSSPASSPDIASADPQLQFFHEHLVVEGEDLQSAFGGDLLTLGMNPRDLQQDDPRHAYATVMAEVRKIADPAVRREMMKTFFNAE